MKEKINNFDKRDVDLDGGRRNIPELFVRVPDSYVVKDAMAALSVEAMGAPVQRWLDPSVISSFNPQYPQKNV